MRIVLIKVAARITESVRRMVFHLPTKYAFKDEFLRAACAMGAAVPSTAT